jgi:sec-independent protein translocase protein TatB
VVFDIGPLEFIALAVIALLVAGPEKLPRYAADAARMLRQLRRMANDARAEVSRELGPEFDDINLADLNPRTLVRKHLIEPLDLDDLKDIGRTGSAGPRSTPTANGEVKPPPYDEDAT